MTNKTIDPSCLYCRGLGQRYVRDKMRPCPCTLLEWSLNEQMRSDSVKFNHDLWWRKWREIKPTI